MKIRHKRMACALLAGLLIWGGLSDMLPTEVRAEGVTSGADQVGNAGNDRTAAPLSAGLPANPETQETSALPVAVESPEPSVIPPAAETPDPSAGPSATEIPEPSAGPSTTETPEPSASPEPMETPEPTSEPVPVGTPEISPFLQQPNALPPVSASLDLTSDFTGEDFKIDNSLTYNVTMNITGTGVEKPVVVLTVPKGITIKYYPKEDDQTLRPNLEAGSQVLKGTDSEGNETLTYHFKSNITTLGFNITLMPTYKLMEKSYGVTAEYYDGTQLIDQKTVNTKFYNKTLHLGGLNLSNGGNKQSVLLNGSTNYDMPCKVNTSGYTGHYAYDSVKLEIPIPEEVVPGFGEKDNYVPMEEGVAYPVEDQYGEYQVTYRASYAYESADQSVKGSTKTLIYDFPSEHKLVSDSSSVNLTGNIYLRFTNPSAKLYYNPISGRISAVVGTETILLKDYGTHTGDWNSGLGYNLLFLFKEYNIKDYFNLSSMTYSAEYGTNSSVLPLEYNTYSICSMKNITDYTLYDVKIRFVLDPEVYCDKVRLLLNESGAMPSAASVEYQTKNGVKKTEQLNVDKNELTVNADDPITEMTVTLDHLGKVNEYTNMLYIYNTNRDGIDGKSVRNSARIISARCPELTETGIDLGTDDNPYHSEDEAETVTGYLKTTERYSPISSIPSDSLNKGDSVTVSFNAGGYSKILIKNPSYYLVMPKGFILKEFIPTASYAGVPYTLQQRELSDGTQLFTLKYRDGAERSVAYGSMNKMEFFVGPTVDTSKTYSTKLPLGYYVEHEQEMFNTPQYSYVDVNDYNENGSTEDKLGRPYSLSSVQINTIYSISVQGVLDSDAAAGENDEQQFQYGSDGHYNLYFYNGNSSGIEPDDLELQIPLPRKDVSVESGGTSYTSQFDGLLTGPVTLKGDILSGAAVEYSIDGGNEYTAAVQDYKDVTDIRIRSAEGKKFAENTDASVQIPIRAIFPETVSEKDKAYFCPSITYRKTDGAGRDSITAQPAAMVAAAMVIKGTIFKDYNGNGVIDASETNPGKSYTVKLFQGNTTDAGALGTTASTAATGNYQIGFLLPGTYTLKVYKDDDEFYLANSQFDDNGAYTFTVGEETKPDLSEVNLGIISGRTMETNFSTVLILEGKTRQIVPTINPQLTADEKITYESADTSVAAVGEDGTIHFVAEGDTTVTVTVPQLSGLVSLGSAPTVTKEIKVSCQLEGCHLTTNLYFASSSSSAPQSGISELNYSYSAQSGYGSVYCLFEDRGYCNEPTHKKKGIEVEVVNDAGAALQVTSQYDYETHSLIYFTYSGAGNIKLKASDGRGHANMAESTLTIHIKPRVSFQANGGTGSVSSKEVICGEPYGDLPQPVRTGYEFLGWFTEQSGGNEVKSTDTVALTANQTLYAHWKAVTYEVTYDANTADPSVTGMPDKAQQKIHDVDLKLSAAQPKRTGYQFDKWNTRADGNGTAYAAGDIYKKNEGICLYACWKPNTDTKYVVNHYKQNVDGVGYGQPEIENLEGTTEKQVTPAVKDYTGFTGPAPQKITIAADGSTVLDYKYNRNQYSLTAAAGAGIRETTGSASFVYYDATVKIEAAPDDGYHFKEWTSSSPSLVPGSQTAVYEFHMPAKEVTLTARAEPDIYKITYDLGKGTCEGNPSDYTVETATFSLKEPVQNGYNFVGWTGSNGENPQKTVTIEKGSTGDKKYKAGWKPVEYKIGYELDGGSAQGNPETYTVETADITLTNPVKTGYTFLGWSRVSGGIPEETAVIEQGSTGDLTFFAHWAAGQDTTYTVNHYLPDLDGKYILKDREERKGTTNASVTPAVKNYTGFTSPKAQSCVIQADGSTVLDYYYLRNSYRLTFDAAGGEGGTSMGVKYGSKLTAPTVTREGYTFGGWIPALSDTMPAADTQYRAVWTSHVTYDANGGQKAPAGQVLQEGENLTTELPAYAGFAFQGWNSRADGKGKAYRAGQSYSGPDVTLYAQWSQNGYRITGKVVSDEYPVTVTLMAGSRTIAVTETDRNGNYEFNGISPGTYNIVAGRLGHKTMTVMRSITNKDIEQGDILMPEEEVSSLLRIDENLPAIIVGGLEKEALLYAVPDSHIKLWLSISENEKDPKELLEQLDSDKQKKYKPGMLLDISLLKQVNQESLELLDQSGTLLTILIPLPQDQQGKDGYVICRSHGGNLELLTTEPNQYGEYLEVNEQKTELTLHARRFSLYMIAYQDGSNGSPETGGGQSQNTTEGDKHNGVPDTGDESPIGFWLLCECAVLTAGTALVVREIRKRKRKSGSR